MDDDLARSLPEPPPPRPARRDAAIEAALQRFDAGGEAPRVAPGPRPATASPSWWTRIGRPQAGMLVTAALVAVIGVPVALTSIGQRFSATGPETSVTVDVRPAPPSDAPPPRGARPSQPAEAAAPSPQASAPDREAASDPTGPAPAPTALAGNGQPRSAPDAKKASAAPPPSPPPPPPAPEPLAEQADLVASAQRARSEQAREFSPSAATVHAEPMAAPVMAPPLAKAGRSAALADSTDIVVTGSAIRAPVRRGDWNACTVNDPGRSLTRCKGLVDPAAKGPAGRAAAHVADGLSLAWQGDYDRAIAAFDQAIALQPRLAFAYLNRGLARQRNGDLGRAIADLDQAVRNAPNARGYYNRGQLFRQRGDTRRAALDEARAVELDARYEAVVR
jgi:hypothetical protein